MNDVLVVQNVIKNFFAGEKEIKVLKDISFSVAKAEKMSIVGSSGSGKTTLLGLCAGLDNVSSGSINLMGTDLNGISEDERANLRNKHVGFIFQNFQLLPTLTALENVMVPMELQFWKNSTERAKALLDRVGLSHRFDHYPTQLSGGEQQRVALARAFSNKPQILFADEPTGNLDDETSMAIESLMFELNKEEETSLIIVTHDLELSKKTDRIIQLKGGRIVSDQKTGIIVNG